MISDEHAPSKQVQQLISIKVKKYQLIHWTVFHVTYQMNVYLQENVLVTWLGHLSMATDPHLYEQTCKTSLSNCWAMQFFISVLQMQNARSKTLNYFSDGRICTEALLNFVLNIINRPYCSNYFAEQPTL
jgi:hypothetical protein